MEQSHIKSILFTPWRLPYIRAGLRHGIKCFICQYLSEGPEKDDENLVVYRTEKSVVIMNRYPYSRGHVLVAPKKHVPSLVDLDREELEDYARTIKATLIAVKKLLKPDYVNVGINIGRVAGAGLEEHLHVHIIPRWHEADMYVPDKFNEDEILKDMLNICRSLRKEIDSIIKTV